MVDKSSKMWYTKGTSQGVSFSCFFLIKKPLRYARENIQRKDIFYYAI